jgi:PAS domain S-box-containing protein
MAAHLQASFASLKMSEERYRSLFDGVPIGLYRTTPTGQILDVNPALTQMLGFPDQQSALRVNAAEVYVFPDVRERWQALIAQEGIVRDFQTQVQRQDGTIIWVRNNGTLVRDEQGQPLYYEGSLEDITQHQQIEQALRESEELYRLITDSSTDLIALTDFEGNVLFISPSIRWMMGLEPSQVLGLNAFNFVHPEDVASSRKAWERALAGEAVTFMHRAQHIDGDWRWLDGWGKVVQYKGQPRVLVISRDITERKQAEEAIRQLNADLEQRVRERTKELDQERAHLQAILEGMAEGVAYVDTTSERTRYVNRAFTELTGRAPEEVIDLPLSVYKDTLALSDEYDLLIEAIDSTVHRRKTWRGTLKARRKDGLPLELGLTVSVVSGADGQTLGVVILARDVGPEKALQAQKDRFIASASHELRTPIANLNLRLHLARRQPEKIQEHLSVIQNISDYVAELIEALLETSRFERGIISLERKTIPLQDILSAAIVECQLQAEGKHIRLISDLQTEPLVVNIDPIRIRQVADNLILNAINYTPEGGQIRVRAFAEGHVVILHVQDTGIGIAEEDIPRLFEPFYRASSTGKGVGLGLTISKNIIDLHGGKITVESQVGQGSTFSVRLPLDRVG